MRKLKKLCAVLLTVAMLLSCCTAVLSVSAEDVATDETTEATTITEDPVALLYSNAVAAATAEGATTPTVGNTRIAISQSDAWRVASTTPTANSFSDVPSVWLRSNSSSSLDARYGHSDWSYTTPSIRVNYEYGNTANKILTTLLRPNSTPDGNRKNAFMSLYYIAETSGDFTLTDNIGGFTVRESAASGYEVYVTILANGVEIFKSQPLSRVNRIARFSGETFYLEKGQKLEINFTYEYTADTYSGDINIDFDPQISLVSEYVAETPEPTAVGDVSEWMYNQIYAHYVDSGTTGWQQVTQSGPWRMQYGSGTDMKYCKISANDATSPWLDYRY